MASPHQTVQTIVDTGIGTVAVSSPLWLQWLETWLGAFMLVGGAFLVAIRIAIAIREWKREHRQR